MLFEVEKSSKVGKVLSSINTTFLTMIDKKDVLESFNGFGQISSYNFSYNIFPKEIAIRIKPTQSPTVSSDQFRFFNDKKIHEGMGGYNLGPHVWTMSFRDNFTT